MLTPCIASPLTLAFIITLLIASVTTHGGGEEEEEEVDGGKLLVISLDGFRYDFIDKGLPNLKKLSQQGVHAKSMTSSYVTKTFPNHWSIVTGLYEESHGIIANLMVNLTTNTTFNHCSDLSCSSWYGGEPIWNTNEFSNMDSHSHRKKRHGGHEEASTSKQMRRSGVIYWPGIGSHVNNYSVTFSKDFISNESMRLTFRERLDLVLSWFRHDEKPINLGLVYYEQPDEYCHPFGPESSQVSWSLTSLSPLSLSFIPSCCLISILNSHRSMKFSRTLT